MENKREQQSKREQPDYAGLQSVQPHDAPEVVPSSQHPAPLTRSSSISSPQVYTPFQDEKQTYKHDGDYLDARPHYGHPAVYESDAEQLDEKSRSKRVCGVKRAVFLWIIILVILLIVIAAVVGGVLGSLLGGSDSESGSSSSASPKSSSSAGTPPSIQRNTGLAVIQLANSAAQYEYFQDPLGRIVENEFSNGRWSIQGNDVPTGAVIAKDAQSGSPITATSWSSNGATFRQIFYIDQIGRLMTTNTTGTNVWPTSFNILTDDSAATDGIALAACSGTDANGLNGIRVYYASSTKKVIREVGRDFDPSDPSWYMWEAFFGSNVYSGVATVVSNNVNHLYLLNSSSAALQLWTWDYTQNDNTVWIMGVRGQTNITVGSDIAAAYDGVSTDHIFFKDSRNQLVRALYYGRSITGFEEVSTVAPGSKLSATYDTSNSNNGAMVFYQGNSTSIRYETVDRTGQKLRTGVVS